MGKGGNGPMAKKDNFHRNVGTAGAGASIGSCCIAGNDSFCLMFPTLAVKLLQAIALLTSLSVHPDGARKVGRRGAVCSRLATWSIRRYQQLYSKRRPACCNLTPSCSNYAIEVYGSMGFAAASTSTSLRLLDCYAAAGNRLAPLPRLAVEQRGSDSD
jgi:putative component of membrane protein insertase Oxa1/YidC/SpoIIIJ protein YidD